MHFSPVPCDCARRPLPAAWPQTARTFTEASFLLDPPTAVPLQSPLRFITTRETAASQSFLAPSNLSLRKWQLASSHALSLSVSPASLRHGSGLARFLAESNESSLCCNAKREPSWTCLDADAGGAAESLEIKSELLSQSRFTEHTSHANSVLSPTDPAPALTEPVVLGDGGADGHQIIKYVI